VQVGDSEVLPNQVSVLVCKMYHGLVFGMMIAKSLEQLDRQVRAAVRKWLCLPHDTHTAFFHENARNSELEVPRLHYLYHQWRLVAWSKWKSRKTR